MNKKGFISTTLVYTLLVLYLFLILSILVSYSQKNKFIDTIRDSVQEDLRTSTGEAC